MWAIYHHKEKLAEVTEVLESGEKHKLIAVIENEYWTVADRERNQGLYDEITGDLFKYSRDEALYLAGQKNQRDYPNQTEKGE
jgi:hypothetical protein